MSENFGLKIGLEGEKEFKKSLADINNSFKVLGSEQGNRAAEAENRNAPYCFAECRRFFWRERP